MRRRFRIPLAVTLCFATALTLFAATTAGATTLTASFEFFVEDNVAQASNGDTVEVSIEGTFDAGSRVASGEGEFVHLNADGDLFASGTLEVERLVAFQFYGCGVVFGEPLPPDFCGGRVILAVHIVAHPASDPSATLEADALLEVNCQIGDPPPGTSEGIKLNVQDLINFNKHVAGENLFVMQ